MDSPDDDEIRLELRVEPPPRPKPVGLWLALAAVAVVGLLRVPYACILGGLLPFGFFWLGYWTVAGRDHAFTLRARSGSLEVDHERVIERIAWELVREVRDTADGLAIPLTHGRVLRIPSALVPDRRTLMDALPAHVKLVVDRPQQGSGETWKTVALWVAIMLALWFVAEMGWVRW